MSIDAAINSLDSSLLRSYRIPVLVVVAIGLLIAVYFAPIWWVSLTAPNYPAESFPDGVRIHFHMNGVFNGCEKVEKAEIQEDEALDCVHEMDTINHYVGMYPIAAGGVIERAFSPYIIALFLVMLMGFLIKHDRSRMLVMGVGFGAITVWMLLGYYGADGVRLQSGGYIEGLATSLDQDAASHVEASSGSAGLSASQALISELKGEMGNETAGSSASLDDSLKQRLIHDLRETYERDQARLPAAEQEPWAGSGAQLLAWHYAKSLGRYFNNPAEIRPLVSAMSLAGHAAILVLIGAMALLLWGAYRGIRPLYWLLILIPMALPLFFLIDYSAWLWWYGHNLNDMGAFTVKPFMPTVFGDGKVAQFSTHSYPSWGFGLMLLASVALALAALMRRKQLAEAQS